jgi:hypothetical protein
MLTAPSNVHRNNVHRDTQSCKIFFYVLKKSLRKRKIFTLPHHKMQTYKLPTTKPKSYAEKQTAWKKAFQWHSITLRESPSLSKFLIPTVQTIFSVLHRVMLFKYWQRDKRTTVTHHKTNSPPHTTLTDNFHWPKLQNGVRITNLSSSNDSTIVLCVCHRLILVQIGNSVESLNYSAPSGSDGLR